MSAVFLTQRHKTKKGMKEIDNETDEWREGACLGFEHFLPPLLGFEAQMITIILKQNELLK